MKIPDKTFASVSIVEETRTITAKSRRTGEYASIHEAIGKRKIAECFVQCARSLLFGNKIEVARLLAECITEALDEIEDDDDQAVISILREAVNGKDQQ